MKTISKHFDSLKKVEKYQNRLYNKYDSVKLVSFPHFCESGMYIFIVND